MTHQSDTNLLKAGLRIWQQTLIARRAQKGFGIPVRIRAKGEPEAVDLTRSGGLLVHRWRSTAVIGDLRRLGIPLEKHILPPCHACLVQVEKARNIFRAQPLRQQEQRIRHPRLNERGILSVQGVQQGGAVKFRKVHLGVRY